jgi:predicted HTH transcriptional regulator
MNKIRIFISSVQKELEPERLAIASLIGTDPFILNHCEPVLFDKEPISSGKASKPYIDCLDTCGVYLLLISRQYGKPEGDLSATHHEYRHAQSRKMPTLVFVKGSDDDAREPKARELFEETKKDGYTYRRFIDRLDLGTEVRNALIKLLKDTFNITPTAEEEKSGKETLEAVSPFESRQTDAPWADLDERVAEEWLFAIGEIPHKNTPSEIVQHCLHTRGLLWLDQQSGSHFALSAGLVFLGKNPSVRLPHCKVLLDAYKGTEIDPLPVDQATLSMPAPAAIDRVVDFVNKNTRHPPIIKNLRRVALDEYPEKAVREAIVNAIAHRDYEDGSRHIMVEVFHDRIVVSSPGFPPKPLTVAKLLKGKYRPCSRNPVIAQSLATLGLMEQRGTGIARMRAAMLDHGLDAPQIEMRDGYFQVILMGPGDNLKRLRVPDGAGVSVVPPSIEEKLNDRQKKIIQQILKEGFVTSGWCKEKLKVTYDTAQRDLSELVDQDVLIKSGSGRSTKYLLRQNQ